MLREVAELRHGSKAIEFWSQAYSCKSAMPTALGGHALPTAAGDSMPTQSGGHGTLANIVQP
jgi:hypothetical protein